MLFLRVPLWPAAERRRRRNRRHGRHCQRGRPGHPGCNGTRRRADLAARWLRPVLFGRQRAALVRSATHLHRPAAISQQRRVVCRSRSRRSRPPGGHAAHGGEPRRQRNPLRHVGLQFRCAVRDAPDRLDRRCGAADGQSRRNERDQQSDRGFRGRQGVEVCSRGRSRPQAAPPACRSPRPCC